VDNLADRTHYVFSTVILFAFAALISSKQIFGAPIRCMAPAEYGGQWEKYVDEYCFSTNTFTDPTGGYETGVPGKLISVGYYQWVPYFFLVQALLFYLPHMLWSHLSKTVADLDFEAVVKQALEIRHEHDMKQRDVKLKKVAAYLRQVNRHRERTGVVGGLGSFGCFAYISSKALNLFNVIVQFVALSKFVGQGHLGWGFKLVFDALAGKHWDHGGYFPRNAYCKFSQLSDPSLPKERLAQCALMVNMINEKLFAIAYFWFLAVFLWTSIDLAWCVFYYIFGYGRVKFGSGYLKLMDKTDGDELKTERDVRRFIHHSLGHDGLLLFHFIDNHAGHMVAGEIACKYYVKSTNDSEGLLDAEELAVEREDSDEDRQ